jgi:hypothetical protein
MVKAGKAGKARKAGGSELMTDRGINAAVINHASLCKHVADFRWYGRVNQFAIAFICVI